MVPESASREESLFHAARQLADPTSRSGFLEVACRDQPELRRSLESLLAAHDASEHLFQSVPLIARPVGQYAPGTQFAGYELIRQIGQGGAGTVYRARHLATDREVALKVLHAGAGASASQRRRFAIEASAAAKLTHPRIVPVYEVAEHEGIPFLSMKLLEGRTLADRTGVKEEPLSARAATELMIQIMEAVQYAHEHGVLHRDLKPANIFLDREGQPHLTDFGLAKLIESGASITRTAELMGTPGYMSPEQARGGETSAATDVYGLGALFYELLTGRPPFRGETPMETLRQVLDLDPVSPSRVNVAIDSSLALICLKCLEKDPSRRYPSASAFAAELQRWLSDEPILTRPDSLPTQALRWGKRNPVGSALILTLSFAFVGALVLLAQVNRERQKQTALALELRNSNHEFGKLLQRAVGMVRQNLETLWGNAERPSLLVGSEEIAALANRPVVAAKSNAARLTLGLLTDESPTSRALQYGDLLGFLEQSLEASLGRPVRIDVRFYKFVSDCRDDLCAGKIDFARLGALPYLRSKQANSGLQPIATPIAPAKVGVFFTRAGSGILSLADLKDRKIAFGDTNSTVSFRAQIELAKGGVSSTNLAGYGFLDASLEFGEDVRELGIDEAVKRIGFLHSHAQVIEAVLGGRYDAGVAGVRAFQINHSRGLVAIPNTEFMSSRSAWVARAGLETALVAGIRNAMTSLRHEPWLAILPDRPEGYELIQESTFSLERKWLDQVLISFPLPPSGSSTSSVQAVRN